MGKNPRFSGPRKPREVVKVEGRVFDFFRDLLSTRELTASHGPNAVPLSIFSSSRKCQKLVRFCAHFAARSGNVSLSGVRLPRSKLVPMESGFEQRSV